MSCILTEKRVIGKNMKSYSIQENYTATDKQTIFNIEKPFINDTTSVFVNGYLQIFGENKDYLTARYR